MNELKNKDEQYNEFLRYKSNERKISGVEPVLRGFVIIIVAIFSAIIFYNIFINHPQVNTNGIKKISLSDKLNKKEKKGFNIPLFSKRQNLLVLGVDSNGKDTDKFKNTRSDTILLINIDPSSHSINAISIPRDSKVYLADDKGVQKINHAHAIGGVDLTKRTIEDTLGIKVDRYIVINSGAIKELVDIIGGVPVYVEKTLNYDDYSGKLHIHLTKGKHVLNGEQAEGFLRFRHDGLGDIGRTSRQQWFLKSLLDTLRSPSIIPKIPEALKVAMTHIQTDMTLYELSHLVALVRDINSDSIEVATLPGGPSTKGYISYWILDPEKTQEVIDRMIYRVKADSLEDFSVGILYNTEKENQAMAIKTKLEDLGFNVNCLGHGNLPHSQIIVHQNAITTELISKLKRKIPELKNMQFVFSPIKQYCTQSDFTIILSE